MVRLRTHDRSLKVLSLVVIKQEMQFDVGIISGFAIFLYTLIRFEVPEDVVSIRY